MKYLKCVVSKVFGTVAARYHPFVTFGGLMLQHGLPADFHSALVVAVDRLHRTRAHVALHSQKSASITRCFQSRP